jgi:hypothetical protein
VVELIRLANSWRGGDDPASGLDDLVADLSLCPIVLDNQQVRLLIVMCDTHDAGLSSDGVRDSGSPVMIH